MKRNILYTLLLGGTLLTATGCSDWLDVNDNPNEPSVSVISSEYLLTSVQNDMDRERVYYANINYLAQHMTKSGDYAGSYPFLTGNVSNDDFDDYWEDRYARILNLKTIEDKAIEEEDPGMQGIAKTLLGIEFQELVDMFGDVPYTQAALVEEYLNPVYDDAETIYSSIIEDMQAAIDLFDEAINDDSYSSSYLSSADIYFGGDMEGWREYAASVKLGMLMRISNVSSVSTEIKAILDDVLDIDTNVTGNPGYYKAYVNSYNKMNPKYYLWGYSYLDAERSGHKSSNPTEFMVKFLRDTNNPLLRVFADARRYLKDSDDGLSDYAKYDLDQEYYIGTPFGQMTPPPGGYVSKFGWGVLSMTCSTTTGPTQDMIVYPGYLTGFFLAEAALRGLIDGGDSKAQEYYEASITALFNTYETALQSDQSTWISYSWPAGAKDPITGTAAEAAEEYYTQDDASVNWSLMTTDDEKMEAIQMQKWLSLYMVNPLEAWSEVRRTDLPNLPRSHSAYYSYKLMARCLYPQTEMTLNPDNFVSGIDQFEDLIFWDTDNPEREAPTTYD